MGTTMKLTLAALLSGVALFVAVPAASAYTPGLGTEPNYCSQAEAGGKNLTVNDQPQQVGGVYACGPLPMNVGGGPKIPTFWPVSGSAGGFQCTEFAERYLYTVTNLDSRSGNSTEFHRAGKL